MQFLEFAETHSVRRFGYDYWEEVLVSFPEAATFRYRVPGYV
jgi:hypothetical protein